MDLQQEILKLSVPERILIVETIWDSIASEPMVKNQELSNSEKEKIDKRLEKYKKGQMKFSSWKDVRKRIRTRAKDEL